MREVMLSYYAQRAANYDDVYQKPERQEDLQELEDGLIETLQDKRVVELACGTGYWTEKISPYVESLHATDINQTMLDIAQAKKYPEENVSFTLADVFALPAKDYDVNCCFAGFLWSHIKREEYAAVLAQIKNAVGSGCQLVLIDNNYVEGSSRPLARTDAQGNTYQLREQEDGSRVEIIKNFPTDSFLRKRFADVARDIRVSRNEFFWMLTCILK